MEHHTNVCDVMDRREYSAVFNSSHKDSGGDHNNSHAVFNSSHKDSGGEHNDSHAVFNPSHTDNGGEHNDSHAVFNSSHKDSGGEHNDSHAVFNPSHTDNGGEHNDSHAVFNSSHKDSGGEHNDSHDPHEDSGYQRYDNCDRQEKDNLQTIATLETETGFERDSYIHSNQLHTATHTGKSSEQSEENSATPTSRIFNKLEMILNRKTGAQTSLDTSQDRTQHKRKKQTPDRKLPKKAQRKSSSPNHVIDRRRVDRVTQWLGIPGSDTRDCSAKESPGTLVDESNSEATSTKEVVSGDDDLLKFAEILYKCSLCSTLPCILTSRCAFLSHVRKNHVNLGEPGIQCHDCHLHFHTHTDLLVHFSESQCQPHVAITGYDSESQSQKNNRTESLVKPPGEENFEECRDHQKENQLLENPDWSDAESGDDDDEMLMQQQTPSFVMDRSIKKEKEEGDKSTPSNKRGVRSVVQDGRGFELFSPRRVEQVMAAAAAAASSASAVVVAVARGSEPGRTRASTTPRDSERSPPTTRAMAAGSTTLEYHCNQHLNRLQNLADQAIAASSHPSPLRTPPPLPPLPPHRQRGDPNAGGGGGGGGCRSPVFSSAGLPEGFPHAFPGGFTPEFGRFTKLIREGGKIVYFCQVCNVKCQVKAAFQVHCNSVRHHNLVNMASKNKIKVTSPPEVFSSSRGDPGPSPRNTIKMASPPEVSLSRGDPGHGHGHPRTPLREVRPQEMTSPRVSEAAAGYADKMNSLMMQGQQEQHHHQQQRQYQQQHQQQPDASAMLGGGGEKGISLVPVPDQDFTVEPLTLDRHQSRDSKLDRSEGFPCIENLPADHRSSARDFKTDRKSCGEEFRYNENVLGSNRSSVASAFSPESARTSRGIDGLPSSDNLQGDRSLVASPFSSGLARKYCDNEGFPSSENLQGDRTLVASPLSSGSARKYCDSEGFRSSENLQSDRSLVASPLSSGSAKKSCGSEGFPSSENLQGNRSKYCGSEGFDSSDNLPGDSSLPHASPLSSSSAARRSSDRTKSENESIAQTRRRDSMRAKACVGFDEGLHAAMTPPSEHTTTLGFPVQPQSGVSPREGDNKRHSSGPTTPGTGDQPPPDSKRLKLDSSGHTLLDEAGCGQDASPLKREFEKAPTTRHEQNHRGNADVDPAGLSETIGGDSSSVRQKQRFSPQTRLSDPAGLSDTIGGDYSSVSQKQRFSPQSRLSDPTGLSETIGDSSSVSHEHRFSPQTRLSVTAASEHFSFAANSSSAASPGPYHPPAGSVNGSGQPVTMGDFLSADAASGFFPRMLGETWFHEACKGEPISWDGVGGGIPDADDVSMEGCKGPNNEGWKVTKIRDALTGILSASSKGSSVSRDVLLQRVSVTLHDPHVLYWGPACNRAVRDLFPHSLAQRKGKFKKTYFFGVSLLADVSHARADDPVDALSFRPLRDMTQDLEQLLEHLPGLLFWSGEVSRGVSRDEVLHVLAARLAEREVYQWGMQCNKALRILFPLVLMKRKGKYKTVYFGVDFTASAIGIVSAIEATHGQLPGLSSL